MRLQATCQPGVFLQLLLATCSSSPSDKSNLSLQDQANTSLHAHIMEPTSCDQPLSDLDVTLTFTRGRSDGCSLTYAHLGSLFSANKHIWPTDLFVVYPTLMKTRKLSNNDKNNITCFIWPEWYNVLFLYFFRYKVTNGACSWFVFHYKSYLEIFFILWNCAWS